MKLYTEEQAKYFFECGRNYQNNAEITFQVAKEEMPTAPIELPSDEEIGRASFTEKYQVAFNPFASGAKWVLNTLGATINKASDLQSPQEEMYYIQNGFSGNSIVWWAKDSKGYTSNLNEAGKYTKEFAFNQVACGRSGEYAWLCSYVDGIQNKPICTFGDTLNISERIDYDKIQQVKVNCPNGGYHEYEPQTTHPKWATKMICFKCGIIREPTFDERHKYEIPTYEEYYKDTSDEE